MTKPLKFIITGQGRCGSNLLKFALKSHADIKMKGEYFNPRVYPESTEEQGNARARAFFENAGGTAKAVGFKIFPHQAVTKPQKSVWRFLTTKKVFVIHLVRRNSLERLISLHVAKKSKAWVANEKLEKLHDSIQLNKSPEFWLKEIERDQQVEEDLANRFADNNYLRVYYEDLVANWDTGIEEIEEFLRVKKMPLDIQLKKQEKRKKSERLANYDELVEGFKDSEHRWMLD